MPPTDQELIEQIRSGKQYLYARLIERYKDRGYGLAVRILKNREDAEEALQDAFVRAFRALGSFEGKSTFATWFYRIVHNAALSKLAGRKNAVQIDFESVSDSLELIEHTGEASPLASYEMRENIELIRKAIESIPEK